MVFNDDGDSSGKGDVNDDDDDDEAHRCDPGGGEGCSEDEDGKRFQFCRQNKENLESVMMMIVMMMMILGMMIVWMINTAISDGCSTLVL